MPFLPKFENDVFCMRTAWVGHTLIQEGPLRYPLWCEGGLISLFSKNFNFQLISMDMIPSLVDLKQCF